MKRYHGNHLLILWIISSYLLLSILQNDILSILLTKRIHKIESIEQLIAENNLKIIVTKNSGSHHILKTVSYLQIEPQTNHHDHLFPKKYSSSESRLEIIDYTESYNFKTIESLLDHKRVFINSIREIDNILAHYSGYPLIETGQNMSPYFYGYTFRKELNSSIKFKLTRL